MLATSASIIVTITNIMALAQTAMKLGQDVAPFVAILKKLFGKEAITEDELRDAMARSDALNAEIEAQTETGWLPKTG